MKKMRLLLGLLLVSMCASGCSFNDLFPGKKEEEKEQKDDDKKEDKVDVESISIPEKNVEVEIGSYHKINYSILPEKANQEVVYESSDEDLAVVYPDGKIYGIDAGNLVVRVTSVENHDVSDEINVTVIDSVMRYAVVYDGNGGIGYVDDSDSPYEEGSTVTVKQNGFTRNGYEFVNFNTKADGTGTSYNPGNTFIIIDNVTLYAKWHQTAVTTYTLTYNANGGTGTMTDPGSPYAENTQVTVMSNSFNRTGYDFVNFNTKSNGGGTSYVPGSKFTINSNTTLYAQWEEQSSGGDDYYDSITATSGTALLGQLHDLSVTKHTHYNFYSGEINTTNLMKTDPYQNTNYVMDFYSGAPTKNQVVSSGDSGWNREHVWCQSLSNGLYGTSGAGADIQHIRPTIPKLNSDRGNKLYGELNNSGTLSTSKDANNNTVSGGYYSGNVFQPLNNKKGDCARIVMYLYMHYNKYSRVGGTKDGSASTGTLDFDFVIDANSENAAKQLLLTWNAADPVDDIERTRNEAAAEITGCRNPFIDHPEYASKIWG